MAKSKFVAYLLWLFFGWIGVHHFYLKRDRQAFLWFATCGGFGGLGMFQDSWRIPRYVKQANLTDKEYEEKIKELERKHPNRKPPFKWSTFFAQVTFGSLLGYMALAAVPEEPIYGIHLYPVLFWLMPVAVALGVHAVGNIGAQAGGLKWALIGATAAAAVVCVFDNMHAWVPVASAILFNRNGKKWRSKRANNPGFIKRGMVLFALGVVFYGFLGSYLYFNAKMTDSNGDTIKFRDSIANFFKSPMWNEFKESLIQLRNYAKVHGWKKMFDEFIQKMDPHGEKNALKELGLESNATQKDIQTRFKQLSREWHPDRHKDPENKADAQDKFIAIKEAYELLSDIKRRRKQRNQSAQ